MFTGTEPSSILVPRVTRLNAGSGDENGWSSSYSRPETPVTSFYISKVLGEMGSARTSLAVSISLMVIARCISEETCKKVDTCSCRFNNGSIVNLVPKGGKTETLVRFNSCSCHMFPYSFTTIACT